MDEIIMAIDMREKSTIGCAFFNTIDGALSVCQDVSMATMDTVEQLIVHVQPTTILVSGRAPEELLDFLEKRSRYSAGGEAQLFENHWSLSLTSYSRS